MGDRMHQSWTLWTCVGAALVQVAGAQPRRLKIVNGCGTAPLWIAHEAAAAIGPDPQNVKIEPHASHEFLTPDGLSATRYWPKMGCDEHGDHCGLGGSGGPGQACVFKGPDGKDDYSKCAPPIDTKFEATFGHTGAPCSETAQDGCDFVDVSLVDGYTLPFKLEMNGAWCSRASRVIDCSGLSFDKCPAHEVFSAAGVTRDLHATNPNTGKVSGCYSPCSKLVMGKWKNPVLGSRVDPRISPYCCPTPPVTPEACRSGPVGKTAFVSSVHQFCPGVYAYSFDDAVGLAKCHPSTQYVLTFYCPAVPAVQPPKSTPPPPGPPPPGKPPPGKPPPGKPAGKPVPAACKIGSGCAAFVHGRSCQCDEHCHSRQEGCCPDYEAICNKPLTHVLRREEIHEGEGAGADAGPLPVAQRISSAAAMLGCAALVAGFAMAALRPALTRLWRRRQGSATLRRAALVAGGMRPAREEEEEGEEYEMGDDADARTPMIRESL